MLITTQGLVLREVSYKESDKILTVLTRDLGKRTVKARGCRKKNSPLAASAQLLVYSEMTLFEYREHLTLTEGSSLEQFWGVREDIEKLALASYFAEAAEAVAEEGVPNPGLLSLVLNSLYALDTLKKPRALVKAAFELKLLCLTGYEPLLDACAVCGAPEPDQPRWNLSQGILHCARCRGQVGGGVSMPLSPGESGGHASCGLRGPEEAVLLCPAGSGEPAPAGPGACEAYLMTQLERGFRTLDFYKQLRRPQD